MHTAKIWLEATRPKTLIAVVSPVLIANAMAMKIGFFDLRLFLFTLVTGLGIQIGTNLANDYFDCIKGADTINRKGPIRITAAKLASPARVKYAFISVFALTALAGTYLTFVGGPVLALLLTLAIILGIMYTGGPYPLAYLGLGDLFVLIFFGPVALLGAYYLQTKQLDTAALLAGIAPGALSNAILIINNLRDREEDRLANKKTLVVRFGKVFGKVHYTAMLLIACSIPLLFWESHPLCMLASLSIIPATMLITSVLRYKEGESLNSLLEKTGKLLFFYTLLFCLGWML